MTFEQNILIYIKKHHLIQKGQHIIIGVSGGPDSVALAYALNSIKHDLGISITIAHFNHNLRKTSLKDQKFVEEFARKLNITFVTADWKNPKITKQQSLEEQARKKRFEFFGKITNNKKNTIVALAHTQDELAETVLMRILRGSGLQGLQAILPSREIYHTTFIRPFLDITKREVLSYLKNKKVNYIVDESNKNTQFLRNKIRLDLIPYIEKNYNNNIKETLANLSRTTSTDYDFLKNETVRNFKRLAKHNTSKNSIEFSLNEFQKKPQSLQQMLIRQAVENIQGHTNKLTYKHLDEIQDLIQNRPDKSIVNLSSQLQAQKLNNSLIITKLR